MRVSCSAPPELKYAFAHPETAENAMQAAASDLSPEQQQVGISGAGLWSTCCWQAALHTNVGQPACRRRCGVLRPKSQLVELGCRELANLHSVQVPPVSMAPASLAYPH